MEGRKEMPKKKIGITITLLSLILVIGTVFNINIAYSSTEPLVYVDPPEVRDLDPCETFTIAVKVANVTGLYGVDIQFKWDKTILSYVSHIVKIPVEDYPDGVLYRDVLKMKEVVDEDNAIPGSEPGTMAWVSFISMYPALPFDGNGTILEMTFHVESVGICMLEIVMSSLSDQDGFPIMHNVQDGYFSNYVPPTGKIYVDPKNVINSSLTECHNFTVDVDAEVTDLKSFDFYLSFNSTILEATNVVVNPTWLTPTVDIMSSYVHVTSGDAPAPVTGNITLATITFHVLAEGESTIDIHDVSLTDKYENPMSFEEPVDGYFNNMLITRMLVHPPEIIDPTKKPGDIFDIEIRIENAIEMYAYEFKLGYDSNVLICLGAIVIPSNNETNFHVEQLVNDTASGFLWIRVWYYPPAEPITIYAAKTVTRITFDVRAYGQTVLDLYDTVIEDEFGDPIDHVTEDGFFACLIRDVAVINVEAYPNKVYSGRIVNITVEVTNLGDIAETFNVTAYYDDNPIDTITVYALDPGENFTVIFTWNTSGLEPCSNFTISAEAGPVPYEMELEDNVYIDGYVAIKLLGDVNGDGYIDLYDAVELSTAYGTHEGDPNWNPEADLAPPWGVIDIYDAVTLSSRYGQHC